MRIRNKIAKHRLSVFTWAYVAIFVSVLPVRAVAADVSVHASIDSLALWMGEQTRIRLEVAQNEGEQVWLQPPFSDTLITGIEFLKISRPDT